MSAHDFLQLQALDSSLDAITHRRPRLPEKTAHDADVAALAEVQAAADAAQARIDAAQRSIESAEHAAADLTTKRTRLEAQLKTVIAPREAEALMSQIATLNAQRSELDDQELLALDEQAAGEADLATAALLLPDLQVAADASAATLAAALAALDAEAVALHAERDALAVALSPADRATYDHARKQFGGVGVAQLQHSHCSGCHMDLSPAELDLVKAAPAGEPSECPQCGRILIR